MQQFHPLNPTLWRTCKMLAGPTRVRLLRQLLATPDEGVSALGRQVGIREATASQELRRIQSRGLLQSHRIGPLLIYRMTADPQVSTAAPILKALQAALRERPPEQDARICLLAFGLAHPRRIQILQALLRSPCSLSELQFDSRIPAHPFHEHLRTLLYSGFAVRAETRLQSAVPDHPLARTLVRLIQQGITR